MMQASIKSSCLIKNCDGSNMQLGYCVTGLQMCPNGQDNMCNAEETSQPTHAVLPGIAPNSNQISTVPHIVNASFAATSHFP